nr:MAG TPA: hypothetical protein [Caudoviricetes sp.]
MSGRPAAARRALRRGRKTAKRKSRVTLPCSTATTKSLTGRRKASTATPSTGRWTVISGH